MNVEDFTPMQLTEGYYDKDGEVLISSVSGNDIVRLKGAGRTIWLSLNGKNSIGEITDMVCNQFPESPREAILNEVKIILRALSNKNTIVANWNPLLKYTLPQDIR